MLSAYSACDNKKSCYRLVPRCMTRNVCTSRHLSKENGLCMRQLRKKFFDQNVTRCCLELTVLFILSTRLYVLLLDLDGGKKQKDGGKLDFDSATARALGFD